jgi:hypothetical protein
VPPPQLVLRKRTRRRGAGRFRLPVPRLLRWALRKSASMSCPSMAAQHGCAAGDDPKPSWSKPAGASAASEDASPLILALAIVVKLVVARLCLPDVSPARSLHLTCTAAVCRYGLTSATSPESVTLTRVCACEGSKSAIGMPIRICVLMGALSSTSNPERWRARVERMLSASTGP